MKKWCKVFSIVFSLFFCLTIFAACGKFQEVKRASKGITSYEINVNIDDVNHEVSACQKVEVINNYDVELDSVCFNVYSRAFREEASVLPYTSLNEGKCFPNGVNYGDITINSIKVDGVNIEYNYVGEDLNAINIPLNKNLAPKDSVCVEIDYVVKLAECIHRLGYYNESINLGNWFPILAIYENGEYVTSPYYSNGDPFYSDIANFKMSVTYPSEYYLSSSGNEKTIINNDGTKTDNIKAGAVRDFAIFLTKTEVTKSQKVDDILVSYVGYNQDENVDEVLNVATKAVKYFNETFGQYPYETLDIVKAPFLHGGMEYPSVVIVSDSIANQFDLTKVIVHEIAHQWWYAVVGNNEINEAWLDESLTEYSTILFLSDHKEYDVTYEELVSEAFANYTLFADIASTVHKKINTSMLLPVNKYNSEYEYSYMIYVKGVLLFDSISQMVGKENIEKALKKYYKKFKFKIAKTDDLIGVIDNLTNKNVAAIMDSWLNGYAVIGSI